ncbi:MAG: hypothetical protein ACK5PZ_07440, partial [Pirellula sp.]
MELSPVDEGPPARFEPKALASDMFFSPEGLLAPNPSAWRAAASFHFAMNICDFLSAVRLLVHASSEPSGVNTGR